jgi:hypothetical protein
MASERSFVFAYTIGRARLQYRTVTVTVPSVESEQMQCCCCKLPLCQQEEGRWLASVRGTAAQPAQPGRSQPATRPASSRSLACFSTRASEPAHPSPRPMSDQRAMASEDSPYWRVRLLPYLLAAAVSGWKPIVSVFAGSVAASGGGRPASWLLAAYVRPCVCAAQMSLTPCHLRAGTEAHVRGHR